MTSKRRNLKQARVTKHAAIRAHERIGTKREQKFADEAWEFGIAPKEAKGSFRRYLDSFSIESHKNVRVHRGHVWLFAYADHPILITMIPLPSRWVRAVLKITQRNSKQVLKG
jgi:hypothetical protein